jgi:hypothetical protein
MYIKIYIPLHSTECISYTKTLSIRCDIQKAGKWSVWRWFRRYYSWKKQLEETGSPGYSPPKERRGKVNSYHQRRRLEWHPLKRDLKPSRFFCFPFFHSTSFRVFPFIIFLKYSFVISSKGGGFKSGTWKMKRTLRDTAPFCDLLQTAIYGYWC